MVILCTSSPVRELGRRHVYVPEEMPSGQVRVIGFRGIKMSFFMPCCRCYLGEPLTSLHLGFVEREPSAGSCIDVGKGTQSS